MTNLFENAYLGKAYKTRGGDKALFHYKDNRQALLFTESDIIEVYLDGTVDSRFFDTNSDIVSEWQEEINEEELDKLANKSAKRLYTGFMKTIGIWISGFKAGYRKALENETKNC